MRAKLAITVSCVVAAAVVGCRTEPARLAESDAYLTHGDIFQAYWAIEAARQENPDDPVIEKRYWELRVDYLLKRAQVDVFHNEELAALAELEKVLTLDPDNEIALVWIEKARAKLADDARRRGDHARADGRLDDALAAYHEALGYVDGDPRALEGIQLVDETWGKRRSAARGHYLDGLRALSEGEFRRTEYHTDLALVKDPGLQEAKPIRDRARTSQGLDALERAAQMETQGTLKPALAELERARDILGDDVDLDDRIAALESEIEAEGWAHEGEILMYQGEFVKARELLERAFDQSKSQREPYGLMLLTITERELEYRYVSTKDLELQGRYEEAIAGYAAIDDQLPGFLDVKARIADLESAIEIANDEVAAGEKAVSEGDLPAALGRFRDALDAYPAFPGLAERIAELEARIEREAPDGTGTPDGTPPAEDG